MAYFSNGTEGMIYEETYCQHCIHYADCPILNEHFLYNYEKDEKRRAVLDWLIPRKKDGIGNEKCTMFYKGTPEKQEPHIPLKGSVMKLINDDIMPENIWFYCPDCDEEYHLPEDQISCPLCDCTQMVEL